MPLATTRTKSSSGRGSARSSVSIVNGLKRSRATAAVIRMGDSFIGAYPYRRTGVHFAGICALAHILVGEPVSTSPGYALLGKRSLQLAVFVLRRMDDHLPVAGLVLVEAGALDVLELNHDGTRGRPFAQLVEADLADDGLERARVDVVGELVVIERAGRLDGLLQHLHGRVGERRLIEAERIDAGLGRLRLVLLQKVLDAGEAHLRARHEKVVVHQAIELVGQLAHQ